MWAGGRKQAKRKSLRLTQKEFFFTHTHRQAHPFFSSLPFHSSSSKTCMRACLTSFHRLFKSTTYLLLLLLFFAPSPCERGSQSVSFCVVKRSEDNEASQQLEEEEAIDRCCFLAFRRERRERKKVSHTHTHTHKIVTSTVWKQGCQMTREGQEISQTTGKLINLC